MKVRWVLSTAAIAASLLAPAAPRAQETTLVFATTLSPMVAVVKEFLHPWAQRVNETGKGALRLEVRDGPGIANHTTFFDRAMNDVFQVGWGAQSMIAGKFNLTNIVTLPFESAEAEPTALALWRLYKTGQMDAEYADVQPLVFVTFPQTGLHMIRAPRTLDNLDGLKISVVSKNVADALARLGAAPVTLSAPEMYDSLNRRVTDGAAISTNGAQTFKLHEIVAYHVDAPLGSTPAMIFMAKKRFAALPEAARKALLAHSGEAEVRRGGQFQDRQNARVREGLIAKGGHEFVKLSPEQERAWRAKVAPLAAEWAKSTAGGGKALAAFRELLVKAKAGS